MVASLSAVPLAAQGVEDPVNILVVDDLPDKLLGYEVVLEELGQNLVLAHSGTEALRELLEREFAVILLDVNMPDIDGIETAQLIRQHKKTAHTPIIFVTAYADEMQTARGYALGAVDYILSPVVPEILRSKVKVFVDLYRAQRRAEVLAKADAARAAAEEATRRSEFLSLASRELQASLDLEEGMRRLLDLIVPRFADVALLRVGLEEGDELVHWRTAREDGDEGQERVIGLVEKARREGRRLEIPLHVGEVILGQLQLAATPERSFRPGELAILHELVSRAAIALENARLYGSLKREIARTRQAEEKLQDASRRKDEFLAMLSHELRNPLAPIRNAVELIRRIAPPDAKIAWARDMVERQVTHMAQLVDDLLDVSRITQGKITLRKEPIELGKVIAHGVETVRSVIDARQQHLSVTLPPTPVWVSGDFARLSQVIGNLLNNAAKYTGEGGKIELAASVTQGMASVVVRDNGIGIDAQLLPNVFELFTQGTRALDRSAGGLGIGLTVVQRLVALHHGSVEASSEGVGKGAQFKVTLPCISEVAPREPDVEFDFPAPVSAPGKRVLVVDDNVDAAHSVAMFLQMEGHEVKTMTDGAQALECCSVFAPHVVVLDIGLPGINGYEIARRLRELPPTKEALLIALTGYGQKEDEVRATQAGFQHHFVKPADPRAIQAVIAKLKVSAVESTSRTMRSN